MLHRDIKITAFALLLLIAAAAGGCSTAFKRYDDAVRIKEDSVKNYRWNPRIQQFRNGKTLRGTVVAAKLVATPEPCPDPVDTLYQGYIIFLDNLSKEGQYEYIPFEAFESVAPSMGIPEDTVRVFENYNNPRGIKAVRKVHIDTIWNDCNPCNCRTFDMPDFELKLPKIRIGCIQRKYYRGFLELKAGYQIFTEKLLSGQEEGRAGWSGEIAAGVRFGDESNYDSDKWNPSYAIGLIYSTGVNVLNTFNDENISRPAVLFYGRYQSPNNKFFGLCMRPFLYGQFGISIDKLTLDLFRINWCDQCNECGGATDYPTIEAQPNVDWSLPISWGIGAGFDIPVAPVMDLSFDFGYRSLAYGGTTNALDFIVPTGNRIDMFLFRLGFTF